jgi:adenine phosphoribosyltransferase
MIEAAIKQVIRDVPDFPKPGILFKDITPVLKDPELCTAIVEAFAEAVKELKIDAVAGIESRGFLFGLMLANRLNIPFVPIRKKGKLPAETISETYDLEYGTATIEIHRDAFSPGTKVLIHDDLLATGGTVEAAAKLVTQLGGEVAGFSFIIALGFLKGEEKLTNFSDKLVTLVNY